MTSPRTATWTVPAYVHRLPDQVPEIVRCFPDVPAVDPHDADSLRDQIARNLSRGRPTDSTHIVGYGWDCVARRYADLYTTALRRAT